MIWYKSSKQVAMVLSFDITTYLRSEMYAFKFVLKYFNTYNCIYGLMFHGGDSYTLCKAKIVTCS